MARELRHEEEQDYEHNPFPGTTPRFGFQDESRVPRVDTPTSLSSENDDLAFLQGEGWVRVNRVGVEGDFLMLKKLERKVLADDITFIGKTWGGGRYWLEVQNAQRQWVRKFYVNSDPKEYGPPKGSASIPRTDPSTGSPIIIEQGGGMGTDPLVAEQLKRANDERERKDNEIRNLNERILTMQGENNKQMMEMFGKMLAVPKADPLVELQRIAAMRELFAPVAPGERKDTLSDLVKPIIPELTAAFREYITNRPSPAPAIIPDNSSPLERLAAPFLNAFLPIIARGIAQQGAAPKPPLRPVHAGAPVNPAPATGHPHFVQPAPNGHGPVDAIESGGEGAAGEATLLEKIKAHPMTKLCAPVLLSMAKNGTTPESAAEQIDALVPVKFWPVVEALVTRPDMVPYLSLFEPEVANHAPWFHAVADVIKNDYMDSGVAEEDGEEEEADDVTPPSGSSAALPEAASLPAGLVPAGGNGGEGE